MPMKNARLPVSCCFPASIPLFKEDYHIHTNHSHIPKWLPLTVVAVIIRSIFERIYYAAPDQS